MAALPMIISRLCPYTEPVGRLKYLGIGEDLTAWGTDPL